MDPPTNRSTQPPRTTAVRGTAVVQHITKQKKNIEQPTNPQCVHHNSTSGVQQKKRGTIMPETGEGIADNARAGPVWRFLPLHASPRPPLAEYVHSSRCVQQYVSFSRTCVGTEFVPVSCRDFHFFSILRHHGERAIRPREANVQPSPLAELGTAPVMRRGQGRAAVWVGRGATPRPREAEWSSRLAAVFWVCYNKTL